MEGKDIFDDGPAAVLSPSTIYGWKASYSLWLGFLEITYPEALELKVAERITRARVEIYVAYLRENCRDTTIVTEISRLYYCIRTMHPEINWKWLYNLARRIASTAKPLRHKLVYSPELYWVGSRLMDRALMKAKEVGFISKSVAVRYRDGLLIAMLIEAPMRRGPLARLEIGAHLLYIGNRWWVIVPAEFTKTRTSQEYELSKELSRYVTTYLDCIRGKFPGADDHQSMWPYIGRPMTDKMIRRRVVKWTSRMLGFAVTPHRFRNAAATFLSLADPKNVRVAKDLLGHRSFRMTEKHYIDGAQSRIAGRQLATILAKRARS